MQKYELENRDIIHLFSIFGLFPLTQFEHKDKIYRFCIA